jgi:hypothetical protein
MTQYTVHNSKPQNKPTPVLLIGTFMSGSLFSSQKWFANKKERNATFYEACDPEQ